MSGAAHFDSCPRASGILRRFAKTPAVEEKWLRELNLLQPLPTLLRFIYAGVSRDSSYSSCRNRSSTATAATVSSPSEVSTSSQRKEASLQGPDGKVSASSAGTADLGTAWVVCATAAPAWLREGTQ